MKYPRKIAAIVVVTVLAVGGLTAANLAISDNGTWGQSAMASPDGDKSAGKHHGGKNFCKRGGKHGKHGRHGRRGADDLAEKLSIMETEIGIRANQLDDWRDFTDALQATMKHPMGPGSMRPGKPGDNAKPFALADRVADAAIARAKSAEELKQAVAKLRTSLTAEQLDKVKVIEARFRARMARHHGPRRGKSHHGKAPHGDRLAPAPAEKPDTPDADDAKDSL